MLSFVTRRCALLALQLLTVGAAVFVTLRILPDNPAAQIVGTDPTPAALTHARHMLGLDASIGAQLERYVSRDLFHFSLGTSWTTQERVATEIADRLPVTLQLIGLAFAVALLVAVPLGYRAASNPVGRLARTARVYSLFAGAQPDFWCGLLLIFAFTVKLRIFPVPTGLTSATVAPPAPVTHFILIDALLAGEPGTVVNVLWHLALPVLTLAFVLSGPLVKMTRESILAVSGSDFLLYARAAGLPQRRMRAMLVRNALAPILTLCGILLGYMLGGAVLIEYVFSLNGIGLYALDRTLALDYPAVEGAVVVMTAFSLLVYLCIDVVHALIDPRVRMGRRFR
jgi:ABC-type dipeptide/oligopeptide/nickel transport system permease component